ncbi:hypothetical protein JM946_19555 [Steroidobacter sp. S1-65]|uniref:Uncharacterized protein n=1 Tax=Steroidobacter gossypii TaxID=2805490 RepID=A0ABS1X145_9GAMM|nr:hypothetical protein [Steroidobacter gossypii]MBM0106938.1 hypothetical protein [Steroidobacter gossypii]
MKMHVVPGFAAVMLASLAVSACSADERGTHSLGLEVKVTDQAEVADVGLPEYPGATPYKEPGETSSGANIGLSAGSFGFKVAALELSSSDRPEQVAAFYRKALAKYGPVLDCSTGSPRSKRTGVLTCDADDPNSHEIVYKAGTDDNQRIVAIDPLGNGTRISLVHVDTRGASKR